MRLLTLAALALLAGCANFGYYTQAIGGQLSILGRSRPIAEVLDDPAISAEVKSHLARALEIREFASRELGLPDNGSYRRYADLERAFAVWNVFAAPELSLHAHESCFPFAGCVAYRGYFARADAEREAARLRAAGDDVFVGGVIAYSTLGWFNDPLLNTMLGRSEADLAALLFHELAHQKIYLRDDTAFNESFATTVEREGVRRWLAARQAPAEAAAFFERARRREQFTALGLDYRARLEQLYGSELCDDDKRAGKHRLLDALRRDYAGLKAGWNGYAGFDSWFEDLNNAKFIALGLYHARIAAFEALLARHGGDLTAFYQAVEKFAPLSRAEREAELAALSAPQARADQRQATVETGSEVVR